MDKRKSRSNDEENRGGRKRIRIDIRILEKEKDEEAKKVKKSQIFFFKDIEPYYMERTSKEKETSEKNIGNEKNDERPSKHVKQIQNTPSRSEYVVPNSVKKIAKSSKKNGDTVGKNETFTIHDDVPSCMTVPLGDTSDAESYMKSAKKMVSSLGKFM